MNERTEGVPVMSFPKYRVAGSREQLNPTRVPALIMSSRALSISPSPFPFPFLCLLSPSDTILLYCPRLSSFLAFASGTVTSLALAAAAAVGVVLRARSIATDAGICSEVGGPALLGDVVRVLDVTRLVRVFFEARAPVGMSAIAALRFFESSFFAFLSAFFSLFSSKYFGSTKNSAIASREGLRAPRPNLCHNVHKSHVALH